MSLENLPGYGAKDNDDLKNFVPGKIWVHDPCSPPKSYGITPAVLNEENNEKGKRTAEEIMRQCGFSLLYEPKTIPENSKRDQDFVCGADILKVEAECRNNRWRNQPFPFQTIHVPMRKEKSESHLFISRSLNGRYAMMLYLPLVIKWEHEEQIWVQLPSGKWILDDMYNVGYGHRGDIYGYGPYVLFVWKNKDEKWAKTYMDDDGWHQENILIERKDVFEYLAKGRAEDLYLAQTRKKRR